jgi:hypothetical protein
MSAARLRRIVTITLITVGLLLLFFTLLLEPLSLGRTPGFGAVQVFLFLLGLSLLTWGAFLYLGSRRPAANQPSLQADVGKRLSATGLVLAFVSGFSDLIGIGTHVEPEFTRPFVGPLQLGGLGLGVALILAGLVLYATSRGERPTSSLDFLRNANGQSQSKGSGSSG